MPSTPGTPDGPKWPEEGADGGDEAGYEGQTAGEGAKALGGDEPLPKDLLDFMGQLVDLLLREGDQNPDP